MPATMRNQDEAVSAVLGTVLLFGIFTAAIFGTLLASGPLLEKLQGRTATQGVVGDFADVRTATLSLGGADAQRTIDISNPRGALGVGSTGAMLLVYDTSEGGDTDCDFRITSWQTTATSTLPFTTSGCPAAAAGGCAAGVCVDAARVLGGSVQPVASASNAATLTLTSDTIGTDDWRFRLIDATGPTPLVYAEAWLVRSDGLHWSDSNTGATADVWLGFVFSHREGNDFAEKPFPFDVADAADLHVVRLTSYHADPASATNAGGTHELLVGLTDRALRANLDGSGNVATHLRFEFTGTLAAQACFALDFRDLDPVGGEYRDDPALPCSGTQAVKAVAYDSVAGSTTDTFPLEVSHANIRVRLD